MKALLQRVSQASVRVDGELINEINHGLLVFVGIEKSDTPANIVRMAERVLGYRVFQDEKGQMNLNIQQIQGEVLLISQFTLAADTKKGLRAGFSTSKEPEIAKSYYEQLLSIMQQSGTATKPGIFGAHMHIQLINDGPVTFLLEA